MATPIFTLRLAWECDAHSPSWELQTEHPGFGNWMAPALFAYRATSPSPTLLEVGAGRATLTLDTGAALQLGGDGIVLLSPAAARDVAAGGMDPRSLPGLDGVLLSAWHFEADGAESSCATQARVVFATCEGYQELGNASPAHLSEIGLDGLWRPSSFEVLGPDGHVSVTVEVDESGELLTVRREDEHLWDATQYTSVIKIIWKP